MADKIEELDLNGKLSKDELLSVLKKEASCIHIIDIMMADTFLRADARYLPARYRNELLKISTKTFFTRIKDIKEDKKHYEGNVDVNKLKEFLNVLKKQRDDAKVNVELCFLKIARIISVYTTFIREESIHPVGTPFPGGFKVRYEDGNYLCPVKEVQKKNPNALCRFCISKQDESV
ncbi:MAG: DUF2115 domain-containing protein [Methanobacterium paludis]|nr:DUF2115 domain-containing protein [Methanobacterium paludis]